MKHTNNRKSSRGARKNKGFISSKEKEMINKPGFDINDDGGNSHRVGNRVGDNDLGWYNRVPSLLDPVTKVPMIPIHGTLATFNFGGSGRTALQGFKGGVPGIMTLLYQPVIPTETTEAYGTAKDSNIFKMIMKTVFAQIKRNLNGPRQYNTADLMSYMLIITSLSAYMSHLRRAYATTYYTNPYSRYTREVLTDTVYGDGAYKYLVNHGPEFVSRFNNIALQMRNLVMPGEMPVGERWKYLNEHVFADAAVEKPQLIIPIPEGIYGLDYTGGTATKPYRVDFRSLYTMNISMQLEAIQGVVDELLSNEIISYINADLMKAYQVADIQHVIPIDSVHNFIYTPTYSEEFLMQLDGMTMVNIKNDGYNIILNENTLNFDYQMDLSRREHVYTKGWIHYNLGQLWLTTNSTELSRDELVMKTRMTTLIEYDANDDIISMAMGTELYHETSVLFPVEDGEWRESVIEQNAIEVNNLTIDPDQLVFVSLKTAFSHAPAIYILDPENKTVMASTPINNYAMLSVDALRSIHTAVIASLVGVDDRTFIIKELLAK